MAKKTKKTGAKRKITPRTEAILNYGQMKLYEKLDKKFGKMTDSEKESIKERFNKRNARTPKMM